MRKYKILLISLSVLFLMMGVVSAANQINNHPITPTINGLSVSDQNNINVNLKNSKNKQIQSTININGITASVNSNVVSVDVSLPTDTKLITVSNGLISANVNKINAATGSSFHVDINSRYKMFYVILKDINGNPIKNQQISVTINGNTIITNTDGNGQINVAVRTNANSADISYSGTVKQQTSTINNAKHVKIASKIKAKSKTFKVKTKNKKYTVTLKDKNNKPIKNQKVSIKINNKVYYAKTNAKGKVTFKLKKLTKKGKYVTIIKFNGNKNYKPSTQKVKIIVK